MHKRYFLWVSNVLVTMCLLSGCGRPDTSELDFLNELVPVSGTVTMDGEPLVKAVVTFIPVSTNEGGRQAYGSTNDQGVYSLQTPVPNVEQERTQGVLKGEYHVIISKLAMPDGSPVPEGTTLAMAMSEGAAEVVPAKYINPDKPELSASITAAKTDMDFKLQK